MKADPAIIEDIKKLIAEEVARYKLGQLQETDYTVERLMKEEGLSETQARGILNGLFKKGVFTKVKVQNPNGGARIAYRPVKKGG